MQLEAKGICFGYNRREPLFSHVSFGVEKGERVGLLGPSGCGKSTLSKIISGYVKPDAGEIVFEGRRLPDRGYSPVQMIYQHPERAVDLRWKMGRILREAWDPDEAFLKKIGIEEAWLSRWPTELSGGELQRFCIARVLGPKTKFLIADEISTMLDAITQAQIWELLLEITERRQIGMLIVTHNEALAKRVCTRVIHFSELSSGNNLKTPSTIEPLETRQEDQV